MQAIYSAASFKYILAVGGVYFVYTGNSFNFEEILSLFSNITSLFPSGSSYIHINNIPSFAVKIFNPQDSAYMLTHINSGREILSNIGNTGFNFHPIIFHIPRHLLMPFIGYIVYFFYHFNYSKALLNLFERFNKLSSKKVLLNKFLKNTFIDKLLNKFNILKNTLPSVRNIHVFMFGATAQGEDGNGGNKKNDSIKQAKYLKEVSSNSSNLMRQLFNLVTDLEGLVSTFRNILRTGNIDFIIDPDGSSSLEYPGTMTDLEVRGVMTTLDNLDLSIRSRSEAIQNTIGQLDGVHNILDNHNVTHNNGQTLSNLTARSLAAMGRFFSVVREEN